MARLRFKRRFWVIVLLLVIGLLALGVYVVFAPPAIGNIFSNIVMCDRMWPDGNGGFVMGSCPGAPMYDAFATQYGPYEDATLTAQAR